jgi:hypothetical protein
MEPSMADTTTANIGLLIADLNDGFNFGTHVEANFTTIDGLMGLVKCTSTSRPTTTYGGQGIFETDTLRVAVNSGTKAAPVWTYISHAALSGTLAGRPTIGRTVGELYYETDTLRLVVWNGAAWEQKAFANYVCTSSTHPASPFQGLEIYETDTGLSAVYTGSNYAYNLQQIAPTQKLVSNVASVTFNIPSGLNGVMLTWRARSSSAVTAEMLLMQLNGDTGNDYLWEVDQANNATVAGTTSGAATNKIQIGTVTGNSATALYFSSGQTLIDGVSDTTNYKTAAGIGAAFSTTTNMWSGVYGGQWNSAAAVTSVTIFAQTGNLMTGSQFKAYGLM